MTGIRAILAWVFAAFVQLEHSVAGRLTGLEWAKLGGQFLIYLVPFWTLGHFIVGGLRGFLLALLFAAIAVIPQVFGQWLSGYTSVFTRKG